MWNERLTAKRAWITLGLCVTAYELVCPPGELMSEGVDAALEARRGLTIAAIGITAAHLCNVLPPVLDPYVQGMRLVKGRT